MAPEKRNKKIYFNEIKINFQNITKTFYIERRKILRHTFYLAHFISHATMFLQIADCRA